MDYQLLATLIFSKTPRKSKKSFAKKAIVVGYEMVTQTPTAELISTGGEDARNFITGEISKEDEWFAKKSYQLASAIIQGKVAKPAEEKPKSSKRRGKKKSVKTK